MHRKSICHRPQKRILVVSVGNFLRSMTDRLGFGAPRLKSVYRLVLPCICDVDMGMFSHQLYFLPFIPGGNKTYYLSVTVTVQWDGSHETKYGVLLRANTEIAIYSFILNVLYSHPRSPSLIHKVHT